MNFKELTEDEISDFIINDPQLVYMGFCDSELAYMYEHKKYQVKSGSFYIGIENDEKELILILRWEYFTDQCICVHPYLSSKHQGKGLTKDIVKFVIQHLVEKTRVVKVISFIIEPCEAAIRAAESWGCQLEGHIKDCVTWRKELTGIKIYGLSLK